MPFNFYDTHTLLMAVQQLTPAATFLRDRYFPTNDATDIFATDDVLVEFRDGSKKLAPFVALARAASPSCAPATIWNATPRPSWLPVAS